MPPRAKRLGASPSVKAWQPEISSEGKKNPAFFCHFKFTTLRLIIYRVGVRGRWGEEEIDGGREGD